MKNNNEDKIVCKRCNQQFSKAQKGIHDMFCESLTNQSTIEENAEEIQEEKKQQNIINDKIKTEQREPLEKNSQPNKAAIDIDLLLKIILELTKKVKGLEEKIETIIQEKKVIQHINNHCQTEQYLTSINSDQILQESQKDQKVPQLIASVSEKNISFGKFTKTPIQENENIKQNMGQQQFETEIQIQIDLFEEMCDKPKKIKKVVENSIEHQKSERCFDQKQSQIRDDSNSLISKNYVLVNDWDQVLSKIIPQKQPKIPLKQRDQLFPQGTTNEKKAEKHLSVSTQTKNPLLFCNVEWCQNFFFREKDWRIHQKVKHQISK